MKSLSDVFPKLFEDDSGVMNVLVLTPSTVLITVLKETIQN